MLSCLTHCANAAGVEPRRIRLAFETTTHGPWSRTGALFVHMYKHLGSCGFGGSLIGFFCVLLGFFSVFVSVSTLFECF